MSNNFVYRASSLSTVPDLSTSLTLAVNATIGRNRVGRNAMSINAFYAGGSAHDMSARLGPGTVNTVTGVITPATVSVSNTAVKAIIVYTTGKIRVTYVVDNASRHVDINKLWVSDEEMTDIQILNMSTQDSVDLAIALVR